MTERHNAAAQAGRGMLSRRHAVIREFGGRRIMGRLGTWTVWLAAAIATPAGAVDRPQLLPTRDVAIIYSLPGGDMGGGAQKLEASYADSGRRIRLDFFRFSEAKVPFVTWIYDGNRDRLTKVLPERREYTVQDSPSRPAPGEFLTSEMQFEKQRAAAVAGQPCMNWSIKSSDPVANGTVACITEEGVLLRMAAPDQNVPPVMLARSVQYGALAENLFLPPPGFMRAASKP